MVVDVPLSGVTLSSLYHLATLVPGLPIAQWLPSEDLLKPVFGVVKPALTSVSFSVDAAGSRILSISCTVALGVAGTGVQLTPSGFTGVSAAVDLLVLTVADPLSADRAASVRIVGTMTLGKLKLDADLDCPSLVFTVSQPKLASLALPDLLDGFDLPLLSVFKGLRSSRGWRSASTHATAPPMCNAPLAPMRAIHSR